jgi:hypothetical protein
MNEEVRWTEDKRVMRFLALFDVISVFVWVIGLIFLPDGDRVLAIPVYAGVGMTIIWLFDKYMLKDVDLIYEFKNKNYNVGLWLLGLFIFIAACISVIS